MDQTKPPTTASNMKKIFIQRDYSQGTNIRFQTKYPKELIEDDDIKNKVTFHSSIYHV